MRRQFVEWWLTNVMGAFVTKRLTRIAATFAAAVVLALNGVLLAFSFGLV